MGGDQFATCFEARKSPINMIKTMSKTNPPKSAMVITCGEQSENHVGMTKQGDGLAQFGFDIETLENIKEKFEELGGETEWLNCNDFLDEQDDFTDQAAVLVLRKGVEVIGKVDAKDTREELKNNAKWDKIFYDARYSKDWKNKRARYNTCFGEEEKELDKEEKRGSITSYKSCPLFSAWKIEMEKMLGETSLEAEGNYYYDINKTGIGWHGDGERKKVAAASFCDEGVVRQIKWQWFEKRKPIGKQMTIELFNGDCYIMSEKATGYDSKLTIQNFDGKKVSRKTLRHAAAVEGSKYFIMAGEKKAQTKSKAKEVPKVQLLKVDDESKPGPKIEILENPDPEILEEAKALETPKVCNCLKAKRKRLSAKIDVPKKETKTVSRLQKIKKEHLKCKKQLFELSFNE